MRLTQTVCRFRHILEQHELGRRLFDEVRGPSGKRMKFLGSRLRGIGEMRELLVTRRIY